MIFRAKIFQFFGYDLFATELGKMIIIPSALASLRDNLELLFAENKIYGTAVWADSTVDNKPKAKNKTLLPYAIISVL